MYNQIKHFNQWGNFEIASFLAEKVRTKDSWQFAEFKIRMAQIIIQSNYDKSKGL